MITFILNAFLAVGIFFAAKAWIESKTVLLTYARKLEKLDNDVNEVMKMRADLVEQQKRVAYTLAKAEQYAAAIQPQIRELNDILASSAGKRTLN